MFKRILVPVDCSDLAEGVLPYVEHLAKALQAKVHLVQVFEISVPPELLALGT
ncbi:MAG: hypothetical protein EHM35_15595, partial [Planctomycetaceae bacterium]